MRQDGINNIYESAISKTTKTALNEGLGSSDKFQSKVKVVVDGPNIAGINQDINANDTFITFEIDLEFRSWGLKDINVYITDDIRVSGQIVTWGDDRDTEEDFNIVIKASDVEISYDSDGSGIVPHELEFTLQDGKAVDVIAHFYFPSV